MFKKEELLKMPEYWMENIQNELHLALKNYMKKHGLNQTQLAKKIGFSKGYISQVLHGNFNHSLNKLIEFAIAIDLAPVIKLEDLKTYIELLDSKPQMRSVPIRIIIHKVSVPCMGKQIQLKNQYSNRQEIALA